MKPRQWVAISSTVILVGGVAISAYAGVQIRGGQIAVAGQYLPAIALNETSTSATPIRVKAEPGDYLGQLSIPSIKKKFNIFQGTDNQTLKKGVGHYIGSVMPGVENNSVLAGHRDTVFSNLGKVKIGAVIRVDMNSGSYRYIVDRIRIVDRNDRTVIVPTSEARLTLSTCYPFSFIGNAPKRYVVIGHIQPPIL